MLIEAAENLPLETLKAQLDAAYLAIEALGRENSRLEGALHAPNTSSDASTVRQEPAGTEADRLALSRDLESLRHEHEAALRKLEIAVSERNMLQVALGAKDDEVRSELLVQVARVNALERDLAVSMSVRNELVKIAGSAEAEKTGLKNQLAAATARIEALGERAATPIAGAVPASAAALSSSAVAASPAGPRRISDAIFDRTATGLRNLGTQLHPMAVARLAKRGARGLAGRVKRKAKAVARSGGNRILNWMTRSAAGWRARFGTPRTMWGVTPILTLPLLARCDRLLGLKSESLVFSTYYITSNFDINLKRLCDVVYARYPNWASRLHKAVLRLALIRYDCFNLFCDRGLLLPTRRMEINPAEMQAMRAFGRRLFTYAYGADVRTQKVTLGQGKRNLCIECPEPGKYCMCDDAEGATNMAAIRQYATAQLSIGDMLDHVPGARKMPYWPLDTGKMNYVGVTWDGQRPLRVAHAPNHPHFKGTRHLIAAIDRLKEEGFAIELVKIQGVPNTEVIKLFESSDLVAEQFVAGFHGYTLLEAMAIGKPALVFVRYPDYMADPDICPIINTEVDTIYDNLRAVLERRIDLAALGERSRRYVERYHSLEAIALQLGRLYLDTQAFPPRILRRIEKRMVKLAAGLPPRIEQPPPIPWSAIKDKDMSADGASPQRVVEGGA